MYAFCMTAYNQGIFEKNRQSLTYIVNVVISPKRCKIERYMPIY